MERVYLIYHLNSLYRNKNLLLNSYFLTDSRNTFRNQDLRVNLYIPENQVVYFDESSRVFLRNIKTVNNIYSRDMVKHYFKMTDEGLECLDCPPPKAESEDDENDEVKDGVNINLSKDSLKVEINDNGEKAEIKIDKEGVIIK